jgi:hypothetical protein
MPVNIKIPVDHVLDLEESLKTLTGLEVVVGFSGQHEGASLSNAELALIHEHGSPVRNIPARPFFVSGIEEGAKEITDAARQVADQALKRGSSGSTARRVAMDLVGQMAVNAVKKKILANQFTPLKPATIKRKGHDQALIETGQLFDSISYDVRRGRRARS